MTYTRRARTKDEVENEGEGGGIRSRVSEKKGMRTAGAVVASHQQVAHASFTPMRVGVLRELLVYAGARVSSCCLRRLQSMKHNFKKPSRLNEKDNQEK